jgi:hypothetical protein
MRGCRNFRRCFFSRFNCTALAKCPCQPARQVPPVPCTVMPNLAVERNANGKRRCAVFVVLFGRCHPLTFSLGRTPRQPFTPARQLRRVLPHLGHIIRMHPHVSQRHQSSSGAPGLALQALARKPPCNRIAHRAPLEEAVWSCCLLHAPRKQRAMPGALNGKPADIATPVLFGLVYVAFPSIQRHHIAREVPAVLAARRLRSVSLGLLRLALLAHSVCSCSLNFTRGRNAVAAFCLL